MVASASSSIPCAPAIVPAKAEIVSPQPLNAAPRLDAFSTPGSASASPRRSSANDRSNSTLCHVSLVSLSCTDSMARSISYNRSPGPAASAA